MSAAETLETPSVVPTPRPPWVAALVVAALLVFGRSLLAGRTAQLMTDEERRVSLGGQLEEAGLEESRLARQTWGTSAIVSTQAARRGAPGIEACVS